MKEGYISQINHPRLTKLVEFLEQLPDDQFDLSSVAVYESCPRVSDPHACPTVACAIGWAPVVFPELLAYDRPHSEREVNTFKLKPVSLFPGSLDFAQVAFHLFGNPNGLKHVETYRYALSVGGWRQVFAPDHGNNSSWITDNEDFHFCEGDATAKEVAAMLRTLMEIDKVGELGSTYLDDKKPKQEVYQDGFDHIDTDPR